jgi:hypothetical protein
MPPLPGAAGGQQDGQLEEPRNLSPEFDQQRNFSSNSSLVRNSSAVATTTVTVDNGGATHVSPLTSSTAQKSKELLLRIYTEKESRHDLTKYDKITIGDFTKDHILGRMKFILPDRKFPSFWQPDLLTDTPRYVEALFESFGSRYQARRLNDTVLEQAAELWKAAAPIIKKIVDNHRSGVAQKMKSDILTGKTITICDVDLVKKRRYCLNVLHFRILFIGLTYLASRRGDSGGDAAFFKENPIYNEQVLDGLETLFQSYVTSDDPKKLPKIRIEDVNAFHAFAVLCLRHTVGVRTWKRMHRKALLSDFLTTSDEALAFVILENNALVWRDKAYGNERPNTQGRYMKMSENRSVRKDWSDKGKKRYGELFHLVREQRAFSLSTTNEVALKGMWNLSSRNQRRQDNSIANNGLGVDTDEGDERVPFIYEG